MRQELSFTEAILEAQDQILERNKDVFIIGEGVPDPKSVFGTCKDLAKKYPNRVFDSPVSEAGVTGVCIGAAIAGLRPIHVHQRMDFSLYAMDQIINNLAKWKSMFGLERNLGMVIRMTVGRGWGAGNQHAQNLEALFAHIPGLRVFVPHDPFTAKFKFIEAFETNQPVIFLEHKWLHNMKGHVPEYYKAATSIVDHTEGAGPMIISWGSASLVAKQVRNITGCSLLVMNELDSNDLGQKIKYIAAASHVIIISDSWKHGGFHTEVSAFLNNFEINSKLITAPHRYIPSSHIKAKDYYPTVDSVLSFIEELTGNKYERPEGGPPHDVDPFLGKVVSAI